MKANSRSPMNTRTTQRGAQKRRRKGAQIIEFAIILPLFLLLTFGIFEFGRAMMVVEIMTNAAREGARKAAVSGSTQAQVYQTIDTYLTGSGINGYTRSVTPNPASAARGATVTVNISVPFSSVSWSPVLYIQGKTLHSSVTMRKE